MAVLFDIRCDDCGYTEQDNYDEPGKESYGSCPACSRGTMKQLITPVRFSMTPSVQSMQGRTSDGTKWEVGSKVGKFKNGKFTQ